MAADGEGKGKGKWRGRGHMCKRYGWLCVFRPIADRGSYLLVRGSVQVSAVRIRWAKSELPASSLMENCEDARRWWSADAAFMTTGNLGFQKLFQRRPIETSVFNVLRHNFVSFYYYDVCLWSVPTKTRRVHLLIHCLIENFSTSKNKCATNYIYVLKNWI